MEYTAENLEKVVTLFYRSETEQQAQAHQWLTEAQNSQQAWSFVWQLLQPQQGSEVQFFAATTLHTKLLKHWNEVPPEHYEQLKKKILESIINYAMGPKIVLNRLCIGLSAYIIHTVPNHWPNAFEELVRSFQPENLPNVEPKRVIWILLDILTVIPEEFLSANLPSAQRLRVKSLLQKVSSDIFKVIEMCLIHLLNDNFSWDNLTMYLHASKCVSAWMHLEGIEISGCISLVRCLVTLACNTYWKREDPEGMSPDEIELSESALDALSTLMSNSCIHNYPGLVVQLLAEMMSHFSKILQIEHECNDQNRDIVCNIYSLLTLVADTHSKLLIKNLLNDNQEHRELSLSVLRAILQCSDLPGLYPVDESSSSVTFGFWYTLQDDVMSLDEPQCSSCLLIIRPIFRQLVSVMIRKCTFPLLDNDVRWTADDREVFRCYRQDIADTMTYCFNILSFEFLQIVNDKLHEALAQCTRDGTIQMDLWPNIEACLYAFLSVSENIDYENDYLPKLMVMLQDIPYTQLHTRVLVTALNIIGAYAEWITDHPDVLHNVMPLLISGVANPEVSPSATLSLKDLTKNCQRYMIPFSSLILQACQCSLQAGQLRLNECIRLMYCIGKVLSVLPLPTIMEYLNVILAPCFQEIQLFMASQHLTNAVATHLITKLRMLSSLFESLHVSGNVDGCQQPVFIILQNTLPLYKDIASKWCKNSEVMDVLCTMLKNAVSTLMDDCQPLTTEILQLLVTSYRIAPQACIINVAKTLFVLLGKEKENSETSHILLYEIVSVTLHMCTCLTENGVNNLSEQGDVLEAFFSLLSLITKKNPKLLQLQSIDVNALIQCAVICLSLPELQIIKMSAMFLVHFISYSRESSLSNVVQSCGELLVSRILLNLGGATPRSTVDPMTDLLLILNKKYCDDLARWFNTYLAQDNFPSPNITRLQKENFAKMVLREKANKRKLTESVTEFTLICRGILRPENSSV